MIPTQIADENVSIAEQRIFTLLRDDSATRDWTVLHSLGLARRVGGPYGEIDFVVIIPSEGIVCLEVKGGPVFCQSGEWQTIDGQGNLAVLKKSPFMQARDGMFALRESVLQKFGDGAPESRCPLGSAVVFPDVACPPRTPEFERSDVIDYYDLKDPISKSIMRVAHRRLREFQPREGNRHPTPPEVKAIRQFLRPNFDMVVAKGVSIGRTEAKLLRLTEEQYDRLDELEANPRCLFVGAAGTGKTLLALEHARRAERSGFKTLFVCFNRLLSTWLQEQTKELDITVGTWHAIERQLILKSSFEEEFLKEEQKERESGNLGALFKDLYPLYGEAALDELGAPFDVLVMDEAQDLSDRHTLKVLNLALRNGLANGRWAIFGDFTRQALYGETLNPVEVLSQYSEHFVRAKLTLNCRNTRKIAEETSILAGFERPPFRVGVKTGLPVEHIYWKTPSDLIMSVEVVVENLVKQQTPPDSIVLLSPRRLEKSSLAESEKIAGFPVIDISSHNMRLPSSNALKFSTIHSFKGLESQVVIVLDIDAVDGEQQQSLLYVAMSRARSLLILMINKRARKAVETRIHEASNFFGT